MARWQVSEIKLSEKVQRYLLNGEGTLSKQKAVATTLAKLAPVDYTEALLTGEAGVTIGAELLTAEDLVHAFEEEIQLSKAVLFELQQQNYFNKIVAKEFITEQQKVYRDCIKQLKTQGESV